MTAALLAVVTLLSLPAPGRLVVRSPHYGAVILVDREPVGRVPLAPLPLAAGFHLVEATAPGRARWGRLVFVTPGHDVVVEVQWPERLRAAVQALPASSPKPTPPAPRLQLAAAAEVASGKLGTRHDTDLRLRWRLEGSRLWGGRGAAVIAGRALNDLAGSSRLWRRVQPQRETALRLDEVWIGWRLGQRQLAVGRSARSGPGGAAYLLDGVAMRAPVGPATLELVGGRRGVQWGPRPANPALAGAQVEVAVGPAELAAAHVWHAGTHHTDLTLTAPGATSAGARARWVDGRWANLQAQLRRHAGARTLWARLAADAPRRGPFEWRLSPLGAFGQLPLRQLRAQWGLAQGVSAWRIEADGSLRAGLDSPWRQHEGRLLGGLSGRGLEAAAEARARLSTGPGVAAYDAVRPLVRLGVKGRWGSVGAEGGATWLRLPQQGAARGRWLPHASVQGRLHLARQLSAVATAGTWATHPAWYPEGASIQSVRLGVELR